MKSFLPILVLAIALILCCGCTETSSSPATTATTPLPATAIPAAATTQVQDHTFVQTITYSNDNATTVIQKNKLAKTATIEVTMHFPQPDEGINETAYYQFGTALTAGALQVALFNETALEEFNAQVEAWNAGVCTVRDDSPADQREMAPGDNPLTGYTVQSLTIHILEEGTEAPISEVLISGPNEGDVSISLP